MKRRLMDYLACPICKNIDLELFAFEEGDEVEEGLIFCKACMRYYPIIEGIPHMLPDGLRKEEEDLSFLRKWREKVPRHIIESGKPFNLKREL